MLNGCPSGVAKRKFPQDTRLNVLFPCLGSRTVGFLCFIQEVSQRSFSDEFSLVTFDLLHINEPLTASASAHVSGGGCGPWWAAPVAPTRGENQLTNGKVYLATLTTRSSLCCSVLLNSLRKYLSEECGNRFIESPKPEVSF